MKKRPEIKPRQKEFAITPFTALKGLQGVATEAPALTVPPPKIEPKTETDDVELFFQAMSGIKQLGAKLQKGPAERTVASVKAVIRKIEESEQKLFIEVINGMKLDVRFGDDLPDRPAPAKLLGSNRLRQLRRGAIQIDYELDLHGLTKDEALDALTIFIGGAFRRQQQAVLVITGKGNHSPDEPVLKNAVEKWLRETGKEMIVEFLQAPQQMGGAGAIVVFLKKSADNVHSQD